MELCTKNLELRGVKNLQSKNGNIYYLINCEDLESGDAYQFYCKDSSVFPDSLKKGDKVNLTVTYNKNFNSLIVTAIKKVG